MGATLILSLGHPESLRRTERELGGLGLHESIFRVRRILDSLPPCSSFSFFFLQTGVQKVDKTDSLLGYHA